MSKLLKNLSLFTGGPVGREPAPNEAVPDDGADEVPTTPNAAVSARQVSPRGARSASRALNAVVRASTQVAIATHLEPTPHPKVQRSHSQPGSHGVVLTETEKVRLQVMQVQLKLTALTFYQGPIDGTMNPETVAGVRHFQTLKGMRDSGLLTVGTLNALGIHPLS
jgi:His-Xaa-Ser repeat protein HxsA